MGANRGKELEGKISEALEELKLDNYGVSFIRLYDVTMGYAGIKNPCDFVAYKFPIQYYIECKSTNENTLNLAKITQYDDLIEFSKTKGIRAGVIVWYIEHKETYWVDIRHIQKLMFEGRKSVNIKDLRNMETPSDYIFKLDGITKRVFTDYKLKSFFDYYCAVDYTQKP